MKCPKCRQELKEFGYDGLVNDELFYCSSCQRYFTKKFLESEEARKMEKESYEIPDELLPRQFLKSIDVNDGEILEIAEIPKVRPAEESKFGKMALHILVKLEDGSFRTYQPNKTTIAEFVKAWGKDLRDWVGKKFKVEIQKARVSGQLKEIIYGIPIEEASKK
jgi:hypothetical protein